jgi:hypothetical protein
MVQGLKQKLSDEVLSRHYCGSHWKSGVVKLSLSINALLCGDCKFCLFFAFQAGNIGTRNTFKKAVEDHESLKRNSTH